MMTDHNLDLHGLRVPTRAMDRLFQEISHAIRLRRQGMLILATPGAGISTAMSLIHRGLEKQTPNILFERGMGIRYAGKEFWRYFLIADNHINGMRFDNGQSRTRLVNRLCQRAGKIKAERCVLLIDRAHDIDPIYFDELSRLEDDLKFHGLNLMLCFAGHQKIERIEGLLIQRGIAEPSTRYFSTRVKFNGMSNIDDLKYYLSWFDHEIVDASAQLTYSQYCFAEAYGAGWRLETQAHILWTQLQVYLSEHNDIEMQPIHEIVASVLQRGRDKGRRALPPTSLDWSNAIERSSLPMLRIPNTATPNKRGGR